MVSPMLRTYHLQKDARELIFQEMAQPIQSSISDLETTNCLSNLQLPSTSVWSLNGYEKAELNLLEFENKATICQTPVRVRQDPPTI